MSSILYFSEFSESIKEAKSPDIDLLNNINSEHEFIKNTTSQIERSMRAQSELVSELEAQFEFQNFGENQYKVKHKLGELKAELKRSEIEFNSLCQDSVNYTKTFYVTDDLKNKERLGKWLNKAILDCQKQIENVDSLIRGYKSFILKF